MSMSSEAKYRADTSKYMVSERGRMPYDSRLTEETRVPDDYVPKKDKILGEQICAAIIPYNEKKIQKIEDFITKNISSYYRPGITKFIKKFPINSSGKVIKKEIIKYFR